jgi:predicted Zn finger-like uncharacterized protein
VKYRTTCPHCTSVFRLGADQLDAAQGWAQCGVCGAAFDARPSLLMEDGSPLPAAPAPAEIGPVAVEAAVPDAAPFAEAATRQPAPVTADGFVASVSPDDEPQAAEAPSGIAPHEASAGLSEITIFDPDIPVPDDFGPTLQLQEPAPASPALTYPSADSSAPAASTAPADRVRYTRVEPVPPQPESQDVEPSARHTTRAWGSASVLLLVLLLAQSAYFLRDTLVSQLPQTRPALERMCALLGCTLSLPKNLAHVQIVGSDLETEAGGRLKLTLTLGNRAGHAQAWPVLVLTLTDQRNRPLARRSFAPSEYLGDAQRIAAGMPPRSEQPLSLPLTVHDLQPMGFDLQLVY